MNHLVRHRCAIKLLLPLFLAVLFAVPSAWAGEIILPGKFMERDAPVWVVYRTGRQATGQGTLTVQWTDIHGRVVENREIPFELDDESQVGFSLDLRRAVGMQNELKVHFSFQGVDLEGNRLDREEDAQVSFIASPPDRTWWDYMIIMWQRHSAEKFAELKKLGINAGEVNGRRMQLPDFLLENDLRWYAENVATDFYAEYHRFRPDRRPSWSFTEAKKLFKKDPTSLEAFKRKPSLSDKAWLKKVHDRLIESVKLHSPYRPLFYNLGDESGVANLASFWDFDFSDHSLVEMRIWLRGRYGTLAALNQQWGTNFTDWALVVPMTTEQAMKQADDNFSSWADFKEWMDVAFERSLKMGMDAVHEKDPEAYVLIEGAQIPGWGGYDYQRLTRALNAIEPYDYGANVEIIRSLNPEMVIVNTSFGRAPEENYRVWYEWLHGTRGIIIWDADSEYVGDDLSVGERGREAKEQYRELRSGLGAQLINSRRQADPIAIHYSQPSFRTAWMLDQRPKGGAWVDRTNSTEYRDSKFTLLRLAYCRLLEDLGLQYNFVSKDGIEQGELIRGSYRVLILPRSVALSKEEATALREFTAQGGVLIADTVPGVFDEHSRRLPKSLLSDLFGKFSAQPYSVRSVGKGKVVHLNSNVIDYLQDRLLGKEKELHRTMNQLVRESGVRPQFAVTDSAGNPVVGVETHVFRNGGVNFVGLLMNRQIHTKEIGLPEELTNKRFETPKKVVLTFPDESYLYNVRAGKALGKMKRITVDVAPYEPTLFAVSPSKIGTLTVGAPTRLRRGETGRVSLGFSRSSPAATHVFHVDVVDPSGNVVPHYSGNLLAPGGKTMKLLPIAMNDQPGKWEVRVKDVLSGQTQTAVIKVQ